MASPLSLTTPQLANPDYQLDVGSVLGRTLSVWGRNLVPFMLVGLVVVSPVLLGFLLLGFSPSPSPLAARALDLVSNVLTLALTGAVTFGVFQSLHDRPTDVGEILRKGVSRLGAVWVTGILMGIAVALGTCAFIIPGLLLATRWWVAVPVAVIESRGASAALKRRSELTEGNRWRVFGLLLVTGCMVFFGTLIVASLLGAATASLQPSQREMHPWVQLALEVLVLPLNALAAVAPAVAYHDLRIGREGAEVEELLRVFD